MLADVAGRVATFVWLLELDSDAAEMRTWVAPVREGGRTVRSVELVAPLGVRQERNNTPLRLAAQMPKRDRAWRHAPPTSRPEPDAAELARPPSRSPPG